MAAQFMYNNEDGYYAYLDPDSEDDFSIIWSDWLFVRNFDVIGDSAWIVPAVGVEATRPQFTGGDATIWLANPLPGKRILVNRISTVQGRKQDWSFTLITRES